jgi:PAS domain S-box-containing protein
MRKETSSEYKERFFESIVQSSEDAVISETLDGKIASWNPSAEKMFGYTAEEAIGKPMSIIGRDKNSKEFTEIIEKIKGGKKVERFETQRKTKDGSVLNVSVTVSPIKDDKGNVIGLSAIDRNITKEKRSQGYARSLIEASLDPLVTISAEGKITDVNEASIKATGAERNELIGSDFSEYFTEPKKAKEGYEKVLQEGQVRDYPLTIKHKEGKLMKVLYNASVYKDEKGKVLGVFAAARDITEQKQASQYARSLIEASLDPLVTISPGGKITDVNEASIRATGAKREELIGSDFSEYFTEPTKAKAGYQKVFKEGFVSDYPLTIKHRKGKLMDVLYNASVYKDEKGKVLGVFAAARDITAQKQASQYARSLIEASLDPLVTINVDGKVTDVNKATEKATGLTREQLIGTDFTAYFTQPEKAKAGYEEVFKKGEVRDYLLTIRSVAGKLTNVLYNASVYKDDKGKVIGVFAAAREIGRAELKAAQARELMRTSTQRVFKVGISYKLGKGTVKIHDIDCKKIGIGIIDNVVVKPTKKELINRKVTAMSYSQSKFPREMIVMSPADVRSLGLEEEDTVYVTKSTGGQEDVEFVDEFDHSAGIEEDPSGFTPTPVSESKAIPKVPLIPKSEQPENETKAVGDVPQAEKAGEEPVKEDINEEEPAEEKLPDEEPVETEPVEEKSAEEEPADETTAEEEEVEEEIKKEEPVEGKAQEEEPAEVEESPEEPTSEEPQEEDKKKDNSEEEMKNMSEDKPKKKSKQKHGKKGHKEKEANKKSFESKIDELRN